ncbi:MAG: helicase-related protein, partial [Bacteroidota bacterium]
YNVLVATDIAARGIDITGISHVINYDTPTFAEDYIHRIGRTGRASATGDALTFVSREEEKYLKSIEKFIGKKFEKKKYEGFTNAAPIQRIEKKEHFEELPMQPLSNEHPRSSQHDERFPKKKRTETHSGQPLTSEHPKEQDSPSSPRKKPFQRDRREGNRGESYGRRERSGGERREGFGRREQSGGESREGFGQRERSSGERKEGFGQREHKEGFGRRERSGGPRSESAGRPDRRNDSRGSGFERRDRRNDDRFGRPNRRSQDNNQPRDSFSHQPPNEEGKINSEKKDYRTLFEKKHQHFEKREKNITASQGESAERQFKKKKKLTISNVQPVHQEYADKMKERKEKDEQKKRYGAGSSAFDKYIYLRDNKFTKKKKKRF